MNLLELYIEKPSNYFICAETSKSQFAGGIGKTSQMQYLAHEICGKEVHGRVVIPIYIKMNELNTKRVDSDVLYQYILVHFQNHVTKKAVLEMIQQSLDYQFLFLLDGINEINNYLLESGQTVYDCLANNIKELMRNENVHIIVTSRTGNEILLDEDLKESFEEKYLCVLEHHQYKKYLQMDMREVIPEPLARICENAMLLIMFKRVYEVDKEIALSLKTKYDLMKKYFELDTEYKKNPEWNDHLLRVRRHVINDILPYIAFEVEAANLQGDENLLVKMKYESLLKESMKECETPHNMNLQLIDKVIQMTGLLERKLIFQHDMIRDYFAVQGLEKQWEYSNSRSKVQKFMEALRKNMKYDSSRGMDYNRRTRFVDFCEFLYANRKDGLESFLKKCNMKDASLEHAFLFYFDLAGLYKDLIQPELAEELSDIAIPLLEQLEKDGRYSDFRCADFYNYLGYCIATRNDSIQYLERARNVLEQNDNLSKKEKRLMGRILSNIGAFYYARREFESALTWHKKAMDYRVEKELWEDVINSCRTLMSDYYMLKQYGNAYECYLQGIEFLGEGVVDLEFEERAMGSEIALLGTSDVTEAQKEALLDRLLAQTKTVFEGATTSHRKNMNLLESLYKKLIRLEKWLMQNLNTDTLCGVSLDVDVLHVVLEYKELCLGTLKGTKEAYEL